MRILGRGKTALSIKKIFSKSKIYDDVNENEYDINSTEITVASPGIPPNNFLIKNTKNLISEYDLFAEKMPYTIWISGTNGKTTTTLMIQHLLEEYGSVCGGNIGTPIATLNQSKNIWILETSSFTLHYTKIAKPNLYILLPISEDHISWHKNYDNYENSKLKVLSTLKEGDIAIVPKKYNKYQTNGYLISYDSSDKLCKIFNLDKNKVNFEEPFLMDALLALSTSKILFNTVNYEAINSFVQSPHKLEKIIDSKKRLWINDSKATNIDATINALKCYKNKKIFLILGGDDKGAKMKKLFSEIIKYNVELFLIGNNIKNLLILAKQNNIKCNLSLTLVEAVNNINQKYNKKYNKNYIALLSPACSSLDQFSSYEERGNIFRDMIKLF